MPRFLVNAKIAGPEVSIDNIETGAACGYGLCTSVSAKDERSAELLATKQITRRIETGELCHPASRITSIEVCRKEKVHF